MQFKTMANWKKLTSTTKKAHAIHCTDSIETVITKSSIPQIWDAEKFKVSPYSRTCHIFFGTAWIKQIFGFQSVRDNTRVGTWKQIWQSSIQKKWEVTFRLSIYSAADISLLLNFTADFACISICTSTCKIWAVSEIFKPTQAHYTHWIWGPYLAGSSQS